MEKERERESEKCMYWFTSKRAATARLTQEPGDTIQVSHVSDRDISASFIFLCVSRELNQKGEYWGLILVIT